MSTRRTRRLTILIRCFSSRVIHSP
jgi:hypothetical protein